MRKSLEARVWKRAKGLCEYCHLPQAFHRTPFQIDHVIAEQHGGKTVAENLAVSCLRCNKRKGPNVAGVDPKSGGIVRLFHPRNDAWAEHFRWEDAVLIGRTPIGRTTIAVLGINLPSAIAVREELIAEGVFPS
ncbi:MAG: HNH endonuclease signature motif containing protein [Gemmataceae bacterium]